MLIVVNRQLLRFYVVIAQRAEACVDRSPGLCMSRRGLLTVSLAQTGVVSWGSGVGAGPGARAAQRVAQGQQRQLARRLPAQLLLRARALLRRAAAALLARRAGPGTTADTLTGASLAVHGHVFDATLMSAVLSLT